MKHEAIKRAVLAANVSDTDVALRALDAIDHNDKFRMALQTVVEAAGNKDQKLAWLREIIYEHFPPRSRSDRYARQNKPVTRQFNFSIDAQEVFKLINDQALEECVDLLSNGRIASYIKAVVQKHFSDMVMAVIGIRRESFDRISLDKDSPVGSQITAKIMEKAFPIFVEYFDEVDVSELARKTIAEGTRFGETQLSSAQEYYTRRVRDIFEDEARKRAVALADADALVLLDEMFGPDEEDRKS